MGFSRLHLQRLSSFSDFLPNYFFNPSWHNQHLRRRSDRMQFQITHMRDFQEKNNVQPFLLKHELANFLWVSLFFFPVVCFFLVSTGVNLIFTRALPLQFLYQHLYVLVHQYSHASNLFLWCRDASEIIFAAFSEAVLPGQKQSTSCFHQLAVRFLSPRWTSENSP